MSDNTDTTDDWERWEPCPNCGQASEEGFRQYTNRIEEVSVTDDGALDHIKQSSDFLTVTAILCNGCNETVWERDSCR